MRTLTGGPSTPQGSWSRARAPLPQAPQPISQAASVPQPILEKLAWRRRPRAHPLPRTPPRPVRILDPQHPLEWGSGCSPELQFPSSGTALARCPAMQGKDERSWGHHEAWTQGSQPWERHPLGTKWSEGARVCSRAGRGVGFAASTAQLGRARPLVPLHLRSPPLTWLWPRLQPQDLGERQQPPRRGHGRNAAGPWWAVRQQWTVAEPRARKASAGTEARAPKR